MQHIGLEGYLVTTLARGQLRQIRQQCELLRQAAALPCQLADLLAACPKLLEIRLRLDPLLMLYLPLLIRLTGSLFQLIHIRTGQWFGLDLPVFHRLSGRMQRPAALVDFLTDTLPAGC